MLLNNIIIYLIFIVSVSTIAVPKLIDKVRDIHTKQELVILKGVLQLYEIENNELPETFEDIQHYFDGDGYLFDGHGVEYNYNKRHRKIEGSNNMEVLL